MKTTEKELKKMIDKANKLRLAYNSAKTAYDAAKKEIMETMDSDGIKTAETDTARAIYTSRTDHGLDTKKLKTELPELWQEYPKETTKKYVTIKAV